MKLKIIMEHQNLEHTLSTYIKTHSQKWEQFFDGNLLLVLFGDTFTEYAFVYQNKIWYAEEDNGYCEVEKHDVIPLILNPKTTFYVSNLKDKIEEVIKKREEGYLLVNNLGTYDFESAVEAIWVSKFSPNEKISCNMYDLGGQFASIIMYPNSWRYEKRSEEVKM
jgi:hypothetical protein